MFLFLNMFYLLIIYLFINFIYLIILKIENKKAYALPHEGSNASPCAFAFETLNPMAGMV